MSGLSVPNTSVLVPNKNKSHSSPNIITNDEYTDIPNNITTLPKISKNIIKNEFFGKSNTKPHKLSIIESSNISDSRYIYDQSELLKVSEKVLTSVQSKSNLTERLYFNLPSSKIKSIRKELMNNVY